MVLFVMVPLGDESTLLARATLAAVSLSQLVYLLRSSRIPLQCHLKNTPLGSRLSTQALTRKHLVVNIAKSKSVIAELYVVRQSHTASYTVAQPRNGVGLLVHPPPSAANDQCCAATTSSRVHAHGKDPTMSVHPPRRAYKPACPGVAFVRPADSVRRARREYRTCRISRVQHDRRHHMDGLECILCPAQARVPRLLYALPDAVAVLPRIW